MTAIPISGNLTVMHTKFTLYLNAVCWAVNSWLWFFNAESVALGLTFAAVAAGAAIYAAKTDTYY